jgi:[ribosomal protein S5]-alanine N-acetyltransferase
LESLESQNLKMIFFTVDLLKLITSEKDKLGEVLNIRVPEEWPGPDIAEILPFMVEELEKGLTGPTWNGFIIHKTDNTIIGDMGLKDGPNEEGIADVGYSIIPAYRNQGYATEMLRRVIAWAFQEKGIQIVTADCLCDNIGSIRVLEKAGMHRLEPAENMLYWAIRKDEWVNLCS